MYTLEPLQPSAAYKIVTRLDTLLQLPQLQSEFASPEQKIQLLKTVEEARQEFFGWKSSAFGHPNKAAVPPAAAAVAAAAAAAADVFVAGATGGSTARGKKRSRSLYVRTAVPSPVAIPDCTNTSSNSGGSFTAAAASGAAYVQGASHGTAPPPAAAAAADKPPQAAVQAAAGPKVSLTVAEAVDILNTTKQHGLAYCKDFQPLLLMAWSKVVAQKREKQQRVKIDAADMQLSELLQHWDACEEYLMQYLRAGALDCQAANDACKALQMMLMYVHHYPSTAAAVGEQQLAALVAAAKALNERLSAGVPTAGLSGSSGASDGGHEQLQAPAAAAAPAAPGLMATPDPPALPAAPQAAATLTAQMAAAAASAQAPAPTIPTPPVAAPAAPVALLGGAVPSFDVAERLLLQQIKMQLKPAADQLLRFRRAMQQLRRLAAGDPILDRFWADYEWVVTIASSTGLELRDWQDAFDTLMDNALA